MLTNERWRRVLDGASILALGLFVARLVAEWQHPGLPATMLLSLLFVGLAALLARFAAPSALWPTLLLLGYVLFPKVSPALAWSLAAVALLTVLLNRDFSRGGLASGAGKRARPVALAAAAVALGALAVYVATLAPGLLPADSGELQVVASQLGVAHPPGFALYTVLAHLATLLPIGPGDAFRANLLSAVFAATTLFFIALTVFRLTRSILGGLVAALALGSATTFWSQATTTNIRSLTVLFTAIAFYLLVAIYTQPTSQRGSDRLPYLFVFVVALAVTHHASLAFMGVVWLLALFWILPAPWRRTRRLLGLVLAAVAGLLPLLYFPLRAAVTVRGATPALATWEGFWEHVLALGFRGDFFYFTSVAELWARLQIMGNILLFQFHPLLLVAAAIGFGLLLWRDRLLAFLLGGTFALHTLIAAVYRAPQTVEYMLPAYVPIVLALGYAAVSPVVAARRERQPYPLFSLVRSLCAMVSALLLVVVIRQGMDHWPSFRYLHETEATEVEMSALLAAVPADGVLLADWHWVTPIWYLQDVDGMRPDVSVSYVFPTAEPYGETWARRIATNLDAGFPVVATHYDAVSYTALPPPEPLEDAFLFRQEPLAALPAGFQPLKETLGGSIGLAGFRLAQGTLATSDEAVLTLAWQPVDEAAEPATLFVHLVGASGTLYAQQDLPARPQPAGLTLTQFRLVPTLAAQPGDYTLLVGAYRSSDGAALPAAGGATRLPLGSLTLTPAATAPFTGHEVRRVQVDGSRTLIGFDRDDTLPDRPRLYLHWRAKENYTTEVVDNPSFPFALPPCYGPWGLVDDNCFVTAAPSHYVPFARGIVWRGPSLETTLTSPQPGQEALLPLDFAAGRPLSVDLVVSLRLIGYEPDGFHWAWWDLDDAVPALGAIPTLKWIAGSQVRDLHFVTVSPAATTGQELGALLGLYDAFTQRGLPALDERLAHEFPGVPLGQVYVASPR